VIIMIKYTETASYNQYINNGPDKTVWKPLSADEKVFYLKLIENVKQAFNGNDKKLKGATLENLMTFVYSRFDEVADVYPNQFSGDNQIDHIIEFHDGLVPTFIHNYIGLRIIGESKNHKKSIGVREVADLNELLRSKRAKFGIFSSVKSFSRGRDGNLWQFSEGKRRKLSLSRNVAILGFTLEELETLTENNFYTMLKQKFFNLIDEISDDYTDSLEDNSKIEYPERLHSSLLQLKYNEILTEEEYLSAREKLQIKYGYICSN
jgi:hypothetical protein